MGERARTLIIKNRRLLEGVQGNIETAWKYNQGLGASVSIAGDFTADVAIYTDNADEEGVQVPYQQTTLLGNTSNVPQTWSTTYPVNWIKVVVTNYVSGKVYANLIATNVVV